MFSISAIKMYVKCEYLKKIKRNKQLLSRSNYLQHTDLADSWSCLKHKSLQLFDDIAKNDRIPLTDNIELLRRSHVKM